MLAHVTLFTCAELHGSGEDGETIGQTCFRSWLSADCHHGQSDHTSPQYSEMICIFVSLVDEKIYSYYFLILICMYMGVLLVCISVHHLSCLVSMEAIRGRQSPWNWSYRSLRATMWGWELNAAPLGEEPRSLNCTTFMIFMPLFDN